MCALQLGTGCGVQPLCWIVNSKNLFKLPSRKNTSLHVSIMGFSVESQVQDRDGKWNALIQCQVIYSIQIHMIGRDTDINEISHAQFYRPPMAAKIYCPRSHFPLP